MRTDDKRRLRPLTRSRKLTFSVEIGFPPLTTSKSLQQLASRDPSSTLSQVRVPPSAPPSSSSSSSPSSSPTLSLCTFHPCLFVTSKPDKNPSIHLFHVRSSVWALFSTSSPPTFLFLLPLFGFQSLMDSSSSTTASPTALRSVRSLLRSWSLSRVHHSFRERCVRFLSRPRARLRLFLILCL